MFLIGRAIHLFLVYVVAVVSFGCEDGGRRQTRTITGPSVSSASVTALSILGMPSVLKVGSEAQLRAMASLQTGEPVTPRSIAWTSSDPSVATVSDGLVTALASGEVRISATVGEITSAASLRVRGTTTLTGRITESAPTEDRPVADARLVVLGPSPYAGETVMTDPEGRFVFRDVDGVLAAELSRSGFESQTVRIDTNSSGQPVVRMMPTRTMIRDEAGFSWVPPRHASETAVTNGRLVFDMHWDGAVKVNASAVRWDGDSGANCLEVRDQRAGNIPVFTSDWHWWQMPFVDVRFNLAGGRRYEAKIFPCGKPYPPVIAAYRISIEHPR